MSKFGKWQHMPRNKILEQCPFGDKPFLVTGINKLVEHWELSGGRDIDEERIAGKDFDLLLVAIVQNTRWNLKSYPPHKQKEYIGFTPYFNYVMPLPEVPTELYLKGWQPYYGDGTVEADIPYLFCGHDSVEGRYGNILKTGDPIAGVCGKFWYGNIRPHPYGGDSIIVNPKYYRELPTGLGLS